MNTTSKSENPLVTKPEAPKPACCAPDTLATCCEPAAKGACCGTKTEETAAPSTCGCQKGAA